MLICWLFDVSSHSGSTIEDWVDNVTSKPRCTEWSEDLTYRYTFRAGAEYFLSSLYILGHTVTYFVEHSRVKYSCWKFLRGVFLVLQSADVQTPDDVYIP